MTLITGFSENPETLVSDKKSSSPIVEDGNEGVRANKREEMFVESEEDDELPWRTNLFALYARVFGIILAKWKERMEEANEDEKGRDLDNLILPSNEEWRYQVYYRLVDMQREIDLGIGDDTLRMNEETETEAKQRKDWDWEPHKREYPLRPKSGNVDASVVTLTSAINDTNGSMTEACVEPGWRISDIILAAQVLQGDTPDPRYKDEAEMRRVFGLVYDVLRYKQILDQALRDVGFWYRYNEHVERERIVWLLLYDMQGRKFSRRRDAAMMERRERAFREAGLKDMEDALVETRTRLAASVSRLRIGGSALALDELLPAHLRTAEGVNWREDGASIASGWVNTIKISSKAEFIGEMAKLELRLCVNCNETELDEHHYVFDPICPKVVNLHDKARERLAMSDLVTSHRFVFLERSLCVGAAALAETIRRGRLCGPVVLTHSIAPRHTAYLAGLLADIEDAGRLLAFGTGEQRHEYEQYLDKLGLTAQQCRVFSERYVSPPAFAELDRATMVLCPPPCSYTGVKDVVDLAVARGGDTRLLETLTNIDIELEQPKALLTEQLTTLKHALTRPNVQLLIYEAHSILPSETFEMVDQVVRYANQMATDKYSREHPAKKAKSPMKESSAKTARSSKSGKRGQSQEQKVDSQEERKIDDEEETATRFSADSEIPESDLFEISSADDIYGPESSKWLNDGCYLAVIRRKEMMQFNSLFMIKVAESKGLFGDRTKQQEASPKEDQRVSSPVRQGSQNSNRKSFKRPKIQVDRIAAATHSSILRSSRAKKDHARDKSACPKHARRVKQDELFSRSQMSPSPTPIGPTETWKVFSAIVPQKSESPQEETATARNTSSRIIRSIFAEGTARKSSKVIISDGDSSFSRSLSVKNTRDILPDRYFDRDNRSSKNNENGRSSIFSSGYGAWALANATEKISATNDFSKISDHERDKENSWRYRSTGQSSPLPFENKKSRLYHPGGALKFSRPEISTNPPTRRDEYF